ncbi:MAG TPA: hypothetical protein VE776_08610 [Actinomycetota bacterium]|jgi:hypothetical protein|nr:hypothetical protein [Actinomycetota bacterium]
MQRVEGAKQQEKIVVDDGAPSRSDATRYLCAGAYLDSDFAQAAIHAIVEEEHRAVGPSYGIDLRPILRHCLAARRRHAAQASAITATLLLNLLLFRLEALSFILSIIFVWLAVRASERLREGRGQMSLLRLFIRPLLYTWVAGMITLLLLGPFLLALAAAASFEPSTVPLTPLSVAFREALEIILIALVPYAIVFVGLVARRLTLGTRLRKERFDPDDAPIVRDPRIQKHLERLGSEQYGNATVYSGYSPFLGAGDHVRTLFLPVRLEGQPSTSMKPATSPPRAFQLSALRDHIVERLGRMAIDELEPAAQFGELSIEDRVFAHGTVIRGDRRFLPDGHSRPVTTLAREEIEAVLHHPAEAVRHYTCVRIASWEEEVVLSIFLHLTKTSHALYVEATECLLLPIRKEYHLVDSLTPHPSQLEFALLASRSLWALPQAIVRAPVEVTRLLVSPARRAFSRARLKQAIEHNMAFDFGTKISLREVAAAENFHNYFQDLDSNKHRNFALIYILEAILKFLDDHGVDTSEYRVQQQVILNSGLIMTGGRITTAAMGVGQQSTVRLSNAAERGSSAQNSRTSAGRRTAN